MRRMLRYFGPRTRAVLKICFTHGWTLVNLKGGHVGLTDETGKVVWSGARSPSDYRSDMNAACDIKRILRERGLL